MGADRLSFAQIPLGMLADGLVVGLRALALHLLITLMMLSINALRWSLPNVGGFLPVTLAFVELRPGFGKVRRAQGRARTRGLAELRSSFCHYCHHVITTFL